MGQESINNCKAASETVLNLRGIEKACGWREGGGKVHGRRIEHSYVSSTKHNNYVHLCDDLIDSFKCGGCKIICFLIKAVLTILLLALIIIYMYF